jgi:CheY-like chemotaxis protein
MPTFEKLKILIVDDDPDDQFMLKKIFQSVLPNAEIAVAFDGADCLDYLAANINTLPYLITLDLNMPRVNGIEATLEIKEDARFKAIPVIILSTSDRENDKNLALAAGADDFFTKHIIYEKLQETIKEISDKWISK